MGAKTEYQAAEASSRPGPEDEHRGGLRAGALLGAVLHRPEVSSIAGLIAVFCYFVFTAGDSGFLSASGTRNYLEVAAVIGIIAVPVSLLMIAGEFDLSVGSMIGASGIVVSYAVVYSGWPLWAALLVGMAIAAVVGVFNGMVVVKTVLPSFVVTLGALYVIRGATLALTQNVAGTTSVDGVVGASDGDPLQPLFHGDVFGVDVSLVWFIAITIVATWVLVRTRFGNWIFATGGDVVAARQSGVPVQRVKVTLYVCTACSAALVGVLSSYGINSASVVNGDQMEFKVIVAAVIGGTLLTGGVGSPIGAALGALIFGMVSQGFFFTNIDTNWFQTFIGGMLLVAAFVNMYIRSRALRRDAK